MSCRQAVWWRCSHNGEQASTLRQKLARIQKFTAMVAGLRRDLDLS